MDYYHLGTKFDVSVDSARQKRRHKHKINRNKSSICATSTSWEWVEKLISISLHKDRTPHGISSYSTQQFVSYTAYTIYVTIRHTDLLIDIF